MASHFLSQMFQTKEDAIRIIEKKNKANRLRFILYFRGDERVGVVKRPGIPARWCVITSNGTKEHYKPIGLFDVMSLDQALMAVDKLSEIEPEKVEEFKLECQDGPKEATVFESVEMLDEHIRHICRAMLLEALGAKE